MIDKKLEQELWNNVFKTQINYFQAQIRESSGSSSTSVSNSSSQTAAVSAMSSSGPPPLSSSSAQQQKKLESQANLALFLESARGFYTRLLEDILLKYELGNLSRSLNLMGTRRKTASDRRQSQRKKSEADANDDEKQLKQLHYICQHILTHLGEPLQ